MTLNCPNCGAHLPFALAEDSTAASASETLVLAKEPASQDVNPTDANLWRLKHLMCFPFDTSVRWKPTQPTMRPIVSDKEDEVGILKDSRARQTLDRVARKMQATIRACGEQS
jgi:hypothetical protein